MKNAALALAFVFAACGAKDENGDGIADGIRDPNSISQVAPSTPVGTLTGQLLTSRFLPLADATVSVNVAGRLDSNNQPYRTQTDAEGNFFFKGLPAGSTLQVTMGKAGFATLSAQGTIPSAAGNFPINNANANLGAFVVLELASVWKARLVTQAGRPAKGAKASVQVFPVATVTLNGNYGSGVSSVVVDAVADDVGMLTFPGVPSSVDLARVSGSVTLTVNAFDENGDGNADFLGSVTTYSGQSLTTDPTPRVVTLPQVGSNLPASIIATNVDSMIRPSSPPPSNFVRPMDDLYFTFSQNLLESSILVSVTDESGVTPVMFTRELRQGNVLVVKHPTIGWESGKEYNVSLRATSKDSGYVFTGTGYFFGADPLMPKPFSVSTVQFRKATPTMGTPALTNGDTVIVTFNQPIARPSSSSPPVELFFDLDLENNNMRTTQGEKGASLGWPLSPHEPTSEPGAEFVAQASGYTSRHEFIYAGPTMYPIALATGVFINFSKLMNTDNGYQTIWGVPVTADETTQLGMAIQ
ncbi:MAG: carboxypeptidase-like regulatory domain-containing protein [Myxococcaceae bacterium]|nr:carboxypeptidase-like regulatory domain-containing protein [Myxococcaceae bacterium]